MIQLPRKKLSFWQKVRAFFVSIWWKFRGEALHAQLQDHASPLRDEAQVAVDRVVYETHIAPDCVIGMIFRGGTAIQIKHDPIAGGATSTMFIGTSYDHAATKAIQWLKSEGRGVTNKKTSNVLRADRRKFDAIRRQKQRKKRRHH